MRRFATTLVSALLCGLTACEAGPSAFDRRVEGGSPAGEPILASVDLAAIGLSLDRVDLFAFEAEGPGKSLASPDSNEGVEDRPDGELEEDDWAPDPDARFPRPRKVRGLYVNAWAAGSRGRMDDLLALAKRTEVNSFVIDIKDASGYLSHRTQIPLAHEIGATQEVRIRDLPGLLDRLEEEGIYPVARIVIVKDPLLAESRPELAIQDTAGGVWIDKKGIVWLNPFDQRVWEYHVDIAREVAELGFPEIQWDYVRFPDAPQSDLARAVFAGADGRTKAEAIRDLLEYARDGLSDLDVEVTADVFGMVASSARDIGIGQVWESMVDVVDVMLPMVYPSHYWEGSFGIDQPNAYPYEIVRSALRDAMRRSSGVGDAGLTRPWLQDFSLGSPIYGGPEVRAQIQATYDAGIDEWVLWNPGSRYTESGLEPIEGFETEPLVRVAGGLFPVSRRREAIDSVRAARAAAALVDAQDALAKDTTGLDGVDRAEGDLTTVKTPGPDRASDVIEPDTLGVGR